MSKYGVISGPYFPVFVLNTGKYGPEMTPYLDTFHTVMIAKNRGIVEIVRIIKNVRMQSVFENFLEYFT